MEIKSWGHIQPTFAGCSKTTAKGSTSSLPVASDSVSISNPNIHKNKQKQTSDTQPDKTEPDSQTKEKKKLTVLFYLNGEYQDIGDSVASALPTLGKKGSDGKINILTQLGYKPGRLSSGKGAAKYDVRRYVVSKHDQACNGFNMAKQEGIKQEFACDEVKTFSPDHSITDKKMLENFVEWGMENYPADKYMLVFAGHGKAWKGALELSPAQIKDAVNTGVANSNSKTGNKDKIDVAVFNTCLNASLEALYEMKDMAKFTVASEDIAWGGIEKQWDSLLENASAQIDKTGSFNPKKFSSQMVDYFRDLVAEGKKEEPRIPGEDDMDYLKRKLTRLDNLENYITLSAVDNSKIGEVVESFGKFTKILADAKIPAGKFFETVNQSTDFSQFKGSAFEQANFTAGVKDLGDIMNNVKNAPWCTPELKQCCQEIIDKMDKSLINEMHLGEDHDRFSGFNVNMPANAGVIENTNTEYESGNPAFNRNTGWSSFLTDAAQTSPEKARKRFTELGGANLPENLKEDSPEAKELAKILPKLDLSR